MSSSPKSFTALKEEFDRETAVREASRKERTRVHEEQETEKQRLERRRDLEKSRWGTPEAAYSTWEQRIKTFFTWVEEIYRELKTEATQAKARLGSSTFRVYDGRRWVDKPVWKGLRRRKEQVSELVGSPQTHTVDNLKIEFSGTKDDLGIYTVHSAKRRGRLIQRGDISIVNEREGMSNEFTGYIPIEQAGIVDSIVEQYLTPLAVADMIEREITFVHDLARTFFEHGQELHNLSVEKYTYECEYYPENRQSTEDRQTTFDFAYPKIVVPNPACRNKSWVKSTLHGNVHIKYVAPRPQMSGRGGWG